MGVGSSNPFLAGKRRPIVVGHRGVPRLHQENTLAGFRRAVALGIPAIELDVRLTRDKQVIVFHDHDLRRMTGSSFQADDLTWDQLSRLRLRREVPMGVDATGAPVTVRYEHEETIPLLAEVLAEIAGKVAINVELKLDIPRWWGLEVAVHAARVIAEARAHDQVIVTSFDPRKLRALARAVPGIAFGFCFDDTMLDFASRVVEPRRMLGRILEADLIGRLLGAQLVGAEHTLVGHETVRRLHARGVAIGTHTLFPLGSSTGKPIAPSANTTAEVERLVELGVDWIESDDPERLQALIG